MSFYPTLMQGVEISALVSVLPEVRKLEEILDQFYYRQHEDARLLEYSAMFSKVLAKHVDFFNPLTADQKAQVLFDYYRELSLDSLQKETDYRLAYQALQQKVGGFIEDSTLFDEIYKNSLARVHLLHSCFVVFAIAEVLQLSPSVVKVSSAYQAVSFPKR